MKKIEFDDVGCCLSGDCPFRRECAQHYTSGEWRDESGFTPNVFIDTETKDILCETASMPPMKSPYGEFPENVYSLGNGFVPIKNFKNLIDF